MVSDVSFTLGILDFFLNKITSVATIATAATQAITIPAIAPPLKPEFLDFAKYLLVLIGVSVGSAASGADVIVISLGILGT